MESKERMNLVLSYIDLHLQEVLSVGRIAEYVGYSEYHFLRIFKQSMGMTVMEFLPLF